MFGFSTLIAIYSIVFDDCPTLATVGAPFSTIAQVTEPTELDSAVGPCTIPSKLWDTEYDNLAQEYLGPATEFPLTEHNPACPHLPWPYPLEGANYLEHINYAVYSAAISVPASYAYKLTKQVTVTAGSKSFPINNSSNIITRVGAHLDEVDLIPIIYPYITVGGSNGSGGTG